MIPPESDKCAAAPHNEVSNTHTSGDTHRSHSARHHSHRGHHHSSHNNSHQKPLVSGSNITTTSTAACQVVLSGAAEADTSVAVSTEASLTSEASCVSDEGYRSGSEGTSTRTHDGGHSRQTCSSSSSHCDSMHAGNDKRPATVMHHQRHPHGNSSSGSHDINRCGEECAFCNHECPSPSGGAPASSRHRRPVHRRRAGGESLPNSPTTQPPTGDRDSDGEDGGAILHSHTLDGLAPPSRQFTEVGVVSGDGSGTSDAGQQDGACERSDDNSSNHLFRRVYPNRSTGNNRPDSKVVASQPQAPASVETTAAAVTFHASTEDLIHGGTPSPITTVAAPASSGLSSSAAAQRAKPAAPSSPSADRSVAPDRLTAPWGSSPGYMTNPLSAPLGTDASSSNSIGGHHISLTEGPAFMKKSDSQREEHFYALVGPHQQNLVEKARGRWRRSQRGCPSSNGSSDSRSPSRDDEGNDGVPSERGETDTPANAEMIEKSSRTPQEAAEALWWREKMPRYHRGNVTAYEVQRRVLAATPSRSVSGNVSESATTRVSPVAGLATPLLQPRPLPSAHQDGDAKTSATMAAPTSAATATGGAATHPTPVGSVKDTPCSTPIPQGPAGVAGDSELPLEFHLPPESVYEDSKERSLQLLAPFVPRFFGLRRLPMREVLRRTGVVLPVIPAEVHQVPVSPGGSLPTESTAGESALTTTSMASDTVRAAAAATTARLEKAPSILQKSQSGSPPPSPLPSHTAAYETRAAPTDADNESGKEGDDGVNMCQMVVLEDVCYGFAHPCVLDMKMGQRQYGMHPSPEKKKKKEYRCKISTSGKYGIRLAGYKRWNPQAQAYESRSKRECRTLTLAEVKEEMTAFFNHSRSLERRFGDLLEELRVAFAQQTVFQFFTSSLLFVYDADRPLDTCRLVMVDFAFTYERKELAQGGDPDAVFEYDVGYIKAIDTLLALVS